MPADSRKAALERLPTVLSVGPLNVETGWIRSVELSSSTAGKLTLRQIGEADAAPLFDFYVHGLSEKARVLFAPYPLFHTAPASVEDLAGRIAEWKKEQDWTAIGIVSERQVIGLAVLKRIGTEHVTSAIAVRDAFVKKGLGLLLQTIIIEQARLLRIARFHIKVVSDNAASVRLHEKCGFRKARVLSGLYKEQMDYLRQCDEQEGRHVPDRQIMEMVIDLASAGNAQTQTSEARRQ